MIKLPGFLALLTCAAATAAVELSWAHTAGAAQRLDIAGPAGSVEFGAGVTLLANGNFVVSDSSFSPPGGPQSIGAVYLYSAQGQLISTLLGPKTGDNVGIAVVPLPNGNFVVQSPFFSEGIDTVGAATWVNGTTGLNGVVSDANSLIGTTNNDGFHDSFGVGSHVTALSNGHYVVRSPSWSSPGNRALGAITWGDGTHGTHGRVSAQNSVVGSADFDSVGQQGVLELTNGNYLVASGSWNGVGAVTWFPGDRSKFGVLSAANSLTGTSSAGNIGMTALPNGHYFVSSSGWSDGTSFGLGALTWGNGTTGIVGDVSAANSLVGASTDDSVGNSALAQVAGNNVVLAIPLWDNGDQLDAGAVAWVSGTGGTVGRVSASNALVGTTSNDRVGSFGSNSIHVTKGGNYFVATRDWDRGSVVNAGAITWGSGIAGVSGPISSANSLVGSSPGDMVGGVRTLHSGHAVCVSPLWTNGGLASAGAVTWLKGDAPTIGPISAANSLIGTRANDRVGGFGIEPLTNGNFVVLSPDWSSATAQAVGAVTWASGSGALTGIISSANSLVGSNIADHVGSAGVIALANGNFVVRSTDWNNGVAADVGAITWGSGLAGISGTVNTTNSFVGASTDSPIGEVFPMSGGGYVLIAPYWDGAIENAGAAITSNGVSALVGSHTVANSLTGATSLDFFTATIFDLGGGEFLLSAPRWDVAGLDEVGAVRRSTVSSAESGVMCGTQCQIGLGARDFFSAGEFKVYPDGDYVLPSVFFNHSGLQHVGALTFGRRGSYDTGPVTSDNTLIGEIPNESESIRFHRFGDGSKFLVSGLARNTVVLFQPSFGAGGTGIDLAAHATATASDVVIDVENAGAGSAAVDSTVSVRFDFTSRSGSVSPPPNCIAAMNSGAHAFDCSLLPIAPGSSVRLSFGISGAQSRGFNVSGNVATLALESNMSNNCFMASPGLTARTRIVGAKTGACRLAAIRPVSPPRP